MEEVPVRTRSSPAIGSSQGGNVEAWCRALASCQLRLLDTVLIDDDGRLRSWFYTSSKNNCVTEKERSALNWNKVGKRFSRFAQAANGRHIAVFFGKDGSRRFVEAGPWEALVTANQKERRILLAGVSGIQVFFCPRDIRYWCRLVSSDTHKNLVFLCGSETENLTETIEQKLREYTTSIVRRLNTSLEAHYVSDEGGELWLSSIEHFSGLGLLAAADNPLRNKKKPALPKLLRGPTPQQTPTKVLITKSSPAVDKVHPDPSRASLSNTSEEPHVIDEERDITSQSTTSIQEAMVIEKKQEEEIQKLKQILESERLSRASEVAASKTALRTLQAQHQIRLEESKTTLTTLEERCGRAERKAKDAETRLEREVAAAHSQALAEAALPPPSRNIATLLQQLDAREQDLVQAEAKWSQERRELEAKVSRSASLAALDAAQRYENLRSQYEAEQDLVATVRAELAALRAEHTVSQKAIEDTNRENAQLRAELRQREHCDQAIHQGSRISVGLDRATASLLETNDNKQEDTSIAPEAEQSTAQARLRQLHNKVVFLKSSLAMEMEARHAAENKLEEHISMSSKEREIAKQQLQEATDEREQALEAAEERFAAALDEAQQRSAQLEAKLAQSQSAYTDALQDAGAARRREEAAKAEASRERQARQAADKRAAARTAISLAETSISSVAESKISPEQSIVEAAVVRRLENEKQYLQAQLTSEAMLKGELQLALKNAGEQLEACRREAEESSAQSRANLNQATERYEEAERELKTLEREAESRFNAQQSQLNTVQSAYTKTRDALRAEQAEHAATRLARGELLASISQLRAEQERTENALRVARDRASDDLSAARTAFEEAETEARDHTKRVQTELSRTLLRLTESRDRELELDANLKRLDTLTRRTAHLGRIFSHKTRPLSLAFSTWLRKSQHATKALALADRQKQSDLELTQNIHEFQTLQDNFKALQASKIEALLASDASHAARRDQAVRQEVEHGRDRLVATQVAADAKFSRLSKRIDEADACIANGENERRALSEELRLMLEQSQHDTESIHAMKLSRQREQSSSCGHTLALLKWRFERLRSAVRTFNIESSAFWPAADHCIECPDSSILCEASRLTSIAIEINDNQSTDAAAASLAAACAAMYEAEERVAIDSATRRGELLQKRVKHTDSECAEKIMIMKTGLDAERAISEALQLALVHSNDKATAAEVSGNALRTHLLDALGAKLNSKIEEISSLKVESQEAIKQADDRHNAALVAGRAAVTLWLAEKVMQEKMRQDADAAAGAATLALTEKAADTEEARWRGLVRDAESRGDERQAAAWRAGMEERDRLAKKETSELRSAAEKALAEVKASAAVSLQAVRSDTKKALDKAATLAVQRQAEAVASAEREIARRLRAEKQDALQACLTSSIAIRRSSLASLQSSEEELRTRLKGQCERELEMARKNQTELSDELQDLRERQANEANRIAQLQSERLIAVERAITDTEREAREKAQALALENDRLEAERVACTAIEIKALISEKVYAAEYEGEAQVAKAIQEGIENQEAAVRPLLSRLEVQEERLEATEEMLLNAEKDLTAERRALTEKHQALTAAQLAASWTQLKLTATGMRKLETRRTEFEECQAETEKEFAALQRKSENDQRRAHSVRTQLEAQLAECDKWRHKMHETLVNHERATLLAHKERSAQLGAELEAIVKKRDDAENRKAKLLSYVDDMHTSVRELEQSIRDHCRASAIGPDGRVNVAHAKKKKRMDDDHDMLLSGIEKQRLALNELDNEIATLSDDREAKEDEIKLLERELVELLVTQQKKLLAILQEAASAPREILEDGSHRTNERRKSASLSSSDSDSDSSEDG